jgi:hypothetical protein
MSIDSSERRREWDQSSAERKLTKLYEWCRHSEDTIMRLDREVSLLQRRLEKIEAASAK